MKKSPKIILILTLFYLVSCTTSYQIEFPQDANIYQKDFLVLVDIIEKNHPGLVASPLPVPIFNQWKQSVDKTYKNLENTTDLVYFYMEIARFQALLSDGHSNVYFGRTKNDLFLPMEFAILDNHVYVIHIYNEIHTYLLHKEVKSINGVDVEDLILYAEKHSSTDLNNPYWQHRIKSQAAGFLKDERFYKYLELDNSDHLAEIIYSEGQNELVETVAFQQYDNFAGRYTLQNYTRNEITEVKDEYRYEILDAPNAIYIQLNTLPGKVDTKFISTIFNEAQNLQIPNMILDLRNNTGGNSQWASEFTKYLINDSTLLSVYRGWKRKGGENIAINDGRISLEPQSPHFDGEVYILTGSHTMSSATFFVVAAMDNNLATIIGSPCGNNNVRYGYTDMIELPFTGLKCTTSIRIWERYSIEQDQWNEAIEPHVTITESIEDYKINRDPVFEYLESILN